MCEGSHTNAQESSSSIDPCHVIVMAISFYRLRLAEEEKTAKEQVCPPLLQFGWVINKFPISLCTANRGSKHIAFDWQRFL